MHLTVGSLIGNFILITGSFALLIFLIKKFAWKNISEVFDARAKKIADDIDGAQAAREKAEQLAAKREQELAGSREEAARIIETAKDTAEKQKAGLLAEARAEASRIKEKADQEIAQNHADALNSIKGEVADLSLDLASKLLASELDGQKQSQLIDKYISELGEA